jgi:multiple sugar transport system ATP-binding protein
MAAIDLVNLTKTFGALTAVKDLNLGIADKEFVALLGPSGCGKTTTMNMISGVEHPSGGEIRFNGREISRVPPGSRGIGFVFQNYAIFTHLSVRANLAFGLEIRRLPGAQITAQVEAMARTMRLAAKLDQPASRLNVNELQRLAIGRSAIVRPDIFLLDEPLSNLDAAFRAEMRTELKHLQHEIRQTMVYVTHDQLEAMSMADRIAVMNLGVLQQYGTPLEIYNQPDNLFVARFIGSPSMNLLKCRLAGHNGATRLDFGAAGSVALHDRRLLAQCAHATDPALVLGVRPEQLTLRPDGAAPVESEASLAMTVSFVERVGARTIVHLERDGLVAKVAEKNGYRAELGAPMRIVVPPGAAMLFEARSERRLPERG